MARVSKLHEQGNGPLGEPFDIPDDDTESMDLLQTRLSSVPDASVSGEPAEETLTPGQQAAKAEIYKAVDVLGIASSTFADAKHKLKALTPGQEGYTAAVAEAMRARAAVEGAIRAACYTASMFDRETKRAEGEFPAGPGYRAHLPDGRQGIITKLFPQGEVRDGHVLDARWWVTLGAEKFDIGTTVYVDEFELREDGAYWPKHHASKEAGEPRPGEDRSKALEEAEQPHEPTKLNLQALLYGREVEHSREDKDSVVAILGYQGHDLLCVRLRIDDTLVLERMTLGWIKVSEQKVQEPWSERWSDVLFRLQKARRRIWFDASRHPGVENSSFSAVDDGQEEAREKQWRMEYEKSHGEESQPMTK